jgi:hypothetical protein
MAVLDSRITEYAGQYLWPARPTLAVPSVMLDFYQKQGYGAQIKKNGACTLLVVSPDKQIVGWNRHEELHKTWTPDPKSPSCRRLLELPDQWYAIEAELLHNKTGIKDTLYIFDILAEGHQLIGTTFEERQDRILNLWTNDVKDEHYDYLTIDERLFVAKPLQGSYRAVFDGLTAVEDEGIVCKKLSAELNACNRADSNGKWQIKCRKPTKNYAN